MTTLSISLYMLVFALISALVLIGYLLRPKPAYLKIVEEALEAQEETQLWMSRKVRDRLKEEKHFIAENVSIYFDDSKILLERLGKKQKVIQKLIVPNQNIISSQKSYEDLLQTLHNGVRIYDKYYVNIIFINNQGETEKLKILYIIDKDDSSGTEKVDKIRANAYVDVIAEKVNDIALKNKKVNETAF